MSNIKFTPVSSSNIAAVAHEGKELYIKFNTGRTYKYWPVSHEEYNLILNAASIGNYFHQNIKNNPNYNFQQV